jgi:two-component system chemotaxis sensor kinase CheA
MNQSDLLDQFVVEARECLEAIGQRLLDVERAPGDAALLNDLFRSVHTLKGNCGLFEFKPLEQVVHAGEDLLDRVRNQTLAYTPALADALLAAMDFSAEMIDQIESHGRIDEAASHRARPLAAALRALIDGGPATGDASAPTEAATPAQGAPALTMPDWVAERLDPACRAEHAGAVALRYQPEPDCFFKGEDPWRLACTTPGLVHIQVGPQQAWPEGEELDAWDCYRCNLDIVLLSTAPLAEVEGHYRCVPEQLEAVELTVAAGPAAPPGAAAEPLAAAEPPAAAAAALQQRLAALWADQLTLLRGAGLPPGAVQAAASSLRGLLRCRTDSAAALASLAALPHPLHAADLRAWAQALPGLADGPGAAPERMTGPASPLADRAPPIWTGVPGSDEEGGGGGSSGGDRLQRVLKVSQDKIDRLMDLIGELVVAKNSLPYLAERAEAVFGQRELSREIKAQYAVINRVAEDMQHAIMQVRMLPVGTVFQRFGRLVRDISKKLGKDVQLLIEGEETEADKNVVEALADPLIHLVRNSLDHGLCTPEQRLKLGKPAQGTIRISARQEGDRVLIEISDDGAGVNPERVRAKAVERGLIPADRAATLSDDEAVQLVFLPGFSTAAAITDLSGRGVGMDVVRNAVERLNGTVTLSSRNGLGTTVRLSLPLSMAVSHVMVVESAGRRFGVPMDLITETVRVHADDVHHFKQARTTVLRGRVVPLLALNAVLAIDAEPQRNADGELAVLVLRLGNQGPVGVLVDQFHGASDIILKPLEGVLAGLTGFAGTALMGDGSVLMVLNPKELI